MWNLNKNEQTKQKQTQKQTKGTVGYPGGGNDRMGEKGGREYSQ